MTFKNLFIDHERSKEEEEWVREDLQSRSSALRRSTGR